MASRKSIATWIEFGSIYKRRLATVAATLRHSSRQSLVKDISGHRRPYVARTSPQKPLEKLPQDGENVTRADPTHNEPGRKSARSNAASTSLRRVAAEAQRARGNVVKGKGKKRHIDRHADTKDVKAYCATESYDIASARELLRKQGYEVDPLKDDLYPQDVLHLQTLETSQDGGETQGEGDIFIFSSGSVVFWNVPDAAATKLVSEVLLPAAMNRHLLEEEDYQYFSDPSRDHSVIIGDTIVLGTKPSQDQADSDSDTNATGAKIAYSAALARSTKLAALENSLSHYFSTTRSIPSILSSGSPLRFSRAFILRKTGELLSIRAQLNLYSELTDSLPDLFWDSPHELGLESYYETLGKALDVGVRIKVLNEKMDYASEIAAVLRERLSEKHGTGLEWLIIGLISIEVGFGIWEIWHTRVVSAEDDRTRELLENWLESQVAASKRP
jgi:required for meiotic nuclear division protein 1